MSIIFGALLIFCMVIAAVPLAIIFCINWRVQANKARSLSSFVSKLLTEGRITEEEALHAGVTKSKTYVRYADEQPAPPVKSHPVSSEPVIIRQAEQNTVRQVVLPEKRRVAKPPENRKNASQAMPIDIVLMIGVFFIILAGVIFATTTWSLQTAATKVILLLLSSGIFFGASALAQGKFKLGQTGVTFYILGSIFLPISVLAIGFFSLFGPWLSLYGRGNWLLSTFAFALLSGALFLGQYIYNKAGFRWLSFTASVLAIVSLFLFIKPDIYSATFAVTIYAACLCLCAQKKFEKLAGLGLFSDWMLWAAVCAAGISSLPAHVFSMGKIDILLILSVLLITIMLTYKSVVCASNAIFRSFQVVFLILFTEEVLRTLHYYLAADLRAAFCIIMLAALIIYHFIGMKNLEIKPLKSVAADILFPASVFVLYSYTALAESQGFHVTLGSASDQGICFVMSIIFIAMLAFLARERAGIMYTIPFFLLIPFVHFSGMFDMGTDLLIALVYFIVLLFFSAFSILWKENFYVKSMKLPFLIAVNVIGGFCTLQFWGGNNGNGYCLFVIGIALLWTLRYDKEKHRNYFYVAAALWPAAALVICAAVTHNERMEWCWLLAAVLLGCYAIPSLTGKPALTEETNEALLRVAMIGSWLTSVVILSFIFFSSGSWGSILFGILAVLFTIYDYVLWHRSKVTLPMLLPAAMAYLAVCNIAEIIYENILKQQVSWNFTNSVLTILFLIFLTAGGVFYKQVYSKSGKRVLIDVWTAVAVITPAAFIVGSLPKWQFVGWLLLAGYALRFVNRAGRKAVDKIAKLIAAISVGIAFYVQPFIEWPEIVKWKLYLSIPLILWIFAVRFIWKEKRESAVWIAFGYSIFAFLSLLLEALWSGRLFDALFIGVLALMVLLLALNKKSKRWFLLGACTLIIIALYLSRGLWLSLAWWVYLLLAGSILIAIAVVNEVNRQKGIKLSDKMHQIFEGWEW